MHDDFSSLKHDGRDKSTSMDEWLARHDLTSGSKKSPVELLLETEPWTPRLSPNATSRPGQPQPVEPQAEKEEQPNPPEKDKKAVPIETSVLPSRRHSISVPHQMPRAVIEKEAASAKRSAGPRLSLRPASPSSKVWSLLGELEPEVGSGSSGTELECGTPPSQPESFPASTPTHRRPPHPIRPRSSSVCLATSHSGSNASIFQRQPSTAGHSFSGRSISPSPLPARMPQMSPCGTGPSGLWQGSPIRAARNARTPGTASPASRPRAFKVELDHDLVDLGGLPTPTKSPRWKNHPEEKHNSPSSGEPFFLLSPQLKRHPTERGLSASGQTPSTTTTSSQGLTRTMSKARLPRFTAHENYRISSASVNHRVSSKFDSAEQLASRRKGPCRACHLFICQCPPSCTPEEFQEYLLKVTSSEPPSSEECM